MNTELHLAVDAHGMPVQIRMHTLSLWTKVI